MWNECMSVTKMVTEITARASALDADRQQLLFGWLQAHHAGLPNIDSNLAGHLTEWFGQLPPEGVHWEYRLILSEIAWWRDLDEASLEEFMLSATPIADTGEHK